MLAALATDDLRTVLDHVTECVAASAHDLWTRTCPVTPLSADLALNLGALVLVMADLTAVLAFDVVANAAGVPSTVADIANVVGARQLLVLR